MSKKIEIRTVIPESSKGLYSKYSLVPAEHRPAFVRRALNFYIQEIQGGRISDETVTKEMFYDDNQNQSNGITTNDLMKFIQIIAQNTNLSEYPMNEPKEANKENIEVEEVVSSSNKEEDSINQSSKDRNIKEDNDSKKDDVNQEIDSIIENNNISEDDDILEDDDDDEFTPMEEDEDEISGTIEINDNITLID